MAVKRTGTVFISSKKTLLGWLIFILSKIGKPFYWLFLGLIYFLTYLFQFLSKTISWYQRKIKKIHLPRWRWPHLKLKFPKPKIKKIKITKPKFRLVLPRRKIIWLTVISLFLIVIGWRVFC